MVRSCSDTHALDELVKTGPFKIRFVTCDLPRAKNLVESMRGCDVVVHTAGCVDPHGIPSDLWEINVEGTKVVLDAAAAAGVQQFIHISSLSVIMGDKDCFGITEDEPLRYCREAYANSKIEAEKLVMSFDKKHAMKITALRPGFIYGPNERSWLPKLIAAMRWRTAMLVGDGSKETNLIYVENLCRAIILAIKNPVAYGQIYNLTDGQWVSKRQLFDVICTGLNISKNRLYIPMFVARSLVDFSSFMAMCAPLRMKSRMAVFSRPALRLAGLNQGFDISKAESQLGYIDRIPFEEGMAKTLESFAEKQSRPKRKVSVNRSLQPNN